MVDKDIIFYYQNPVIQLRLYQYYYHLEAMK